MILINSIEGDVSTTDVIRWLKHYKKKFVRLNESDLITDVSVTGDGNILLGINKTAIFSVNDISSYWYRRGQLSILLPSKQERPKTGLQINASKQTEYDAKVIISLIYHKLAQIPHIGTYETCTMVNKLIILEKAKALGIATPPTLITNSRQKVAAFLLQHKEIITKVIFENFTYTYGNYWFPTYTEELTEKKVSQLPQSFGLSLFQKKIQKKIEVRAFYLNGIFYSMAIFSQNDPKTKIDFRKYNYTRPNRNVPYKLPRLLEKKLQALMEYLGFQSGSIDLLVDLSGNYYFLEINPVGQFGFLSQQCNYKIEKKIALFLK